jgi:hypothetical protein
LKSSSYQFPAVRLAVAEQRRLPLHHRPRPAPGRRSPGGQGRIQADPGAATAPLARSGRWRAALAAAGWPRPPGEGPILSLLLGKDAAALAAQERLEAEGLLALAIRPPTVREGTSRLRLVLRSGLPSGTLEKLLEALGRGSRLSPASP